jgi:hypothetical protein
MVGIVFWPICAIRLAKPESFWARHWYDNDKMARAEHEFAPRSQVVAEKQERKARKQRRSA